MYRLGIWLMALALVFNGAAAYAWNDFPDAVTAVAQDHHDGAEAIACNVTSDDGMTTAADVGQTQGAKHDHLKCCGTCNVVSLAPKVDVMPATFSYRAVSFRMTKHDLVGHLVALDPDIPKSIV